MITQEQSARSPEDTTKERIKHALLETAYKQGNDGEGWFRECRFCGEHSRISTHYDDFPHSVACVISDLDRLATAPAQVTREDAFNFCKKRNARVSDTEAHNFADAVMSLLAERGLTK